MNTLADKTLFITGASRGIGLAIALRAARDGARIAIAAKTSTPHPKLPGTIHTAAEQIINAGGRALAIECDIRFEQQIEAAVARTVDEFGGIDIEAPLEGNLLVCRNLDVPGVIGKIGSILGEHGVNIANFALGRERTGPKPVKALAVVQVDAPVPANVLEDLVKIEAMLEARPVSLPETKF